MIVFGETITKIKKKLSILVGPYLILFNDLLVYECDIIMLTYLMLDTGIDMAVRNTGDTQARRGMVLPFQPLSLAFNHVNYYVDMPAVSLFH